MQFYQLIEEMSKSRLTKSGIAHTLNKRCMTSKVHCAIPYEIRCLPSRNESTCNTGLPHFGLPVGLAFVGQLPVHSRRGQKMRVANM